MQGCVGLHGSWLYRDGALPGFFGLLVNTVLFVGITYFASPLPKEHRAKYEEAWSEK